MRCYHSHDICQILDFLKGKPLVSRPILFYFAMIIMMIMVVVMQFGIFSIFSCSLDPSIAAMPTRNSGTADASLATIDWNRLAIPNLTFITTLLFSKF